MADDTTLEIVPDQDPGTPPDELQVTYTVPVVSTLTIKQLQDQNVTDNNNVVVYLQQITDLQALIDKTNANVVARNALIEQIQALT